MTNVIQQNLQYMLEYQRLININNQRYLQSTNIIVPKRRYNRSIEVQSKVNEVSMNDVFIQKYYNQDGNVGNILHGQQNRYRSMMKLIRQSIQSSLQKEREQLKSIDQKKQKKLIFRKNSNGFRNKKFSLIVYGEQKSAQKIQQKQIKSFKLKLCRALTQQNEIKKQVKKQQKKALNRIFHKIQTIQQNKSTKQQQEQLNNNSVHNNKLDNFWKRSAKKNLNNKQVLERQIHKTIDFENRSKSRGYKNQSKIIASYSSVLSLDKLSGWTVKQFNK